MKEEDKFNDHGLITKAERSVIITLMIVFFLCAIWTACLVMTAIIKHIQEQILI